MNFEVTCTCYSKKIVLLSFQFLDCVCFSLWEEAAIEGWIFCKLFGEVDETWQYLAL